ncbi:MAG: hypothetical protein JXB38_12885 [Anaerolineales bacterium]|nr:hypothetical protein [Anaerolineales bacterium]
MGFWETFDNAWKIVRKHKILWLFGLLAYTPYAIFSWTISNKPQNALGITGAFLVFVVFIFISTFGKVGLIQGVTLVKLGRAKLSWLGLLAAQKPHYWKTLVLTAALFTFGWVLRLLIPLIWSFFALFLQTFDLQPEGVWGWLSLLLSGIVVIITALYFGFYRLSPNGLVVEQLGFVAAVERGWDVMRRDWKTVVGTTFTIGIVGAAYVLVSALPLVLLFAIVRFLGLDLFNPALGSWGHGILDDVFVLAFYLPIGVILFAIWAAFEHAIWTLTFLRLTTKDAAVGTDTPPEPQDIPAQA